MFKRSSYWREQIKSYVFLPKFRTKRTVPLYSWGHTTLVGSQNSNQTSDCKTSIHNFSCSCVFHYSFTTDEGIICILKQKLKYLANSIYNFPNLNQYIKLPRWECKLVQPLWRAVWKFLKKLEIELLYDPAIPLLGIHPEETRIERDTCTPMFIAALFTIARTWKQSRYLSADEWTRKLWYAYTMEYYSAIKRMHLSQF